MEVLLTAHKTIQNKPNLNQISDVELFPNPAGNVINVSFSVSDNQDLILRIVDLTGEVLTEKKIACTAGNNLIEIGIESLRFGFYELELYGSSQTVSQKFVKQ